MGVVVVGAIIIVVVVVVGKVVVVVVLVIIIMKKIIIIIKPEGLGNESQTVRTDGILPFTNMQNSLAPYFLFSTIPNASKHLKKRNTPDKKKRKIAPPE